MTPMIETDRLLLSPVCEQDADALHHLWAQPAVRQYLFDDKITPLPQIQAMVAQSIAAFNKNRYGIWIARLKPGEETIPQGLRRNVGFTGYWAFFDPPEVQLIYGLSADYWGKGLAAEMARSMLSYGFQTYKFDVIRASANVPNRRSINLMQRLGMTFADQVVIDGQELVFYELQKPIELPL